METRKRSIISRYGALSDRFPIFLTDNDAGSLFIFNATVNLVRRWEMEELTEEASKQKKKKKLKMGWDFDAYFIWFIE